MEQPVFLPYCKHQITEEDIGAVNDVLQSDWLTQGPVVCEFEAALADYLGAKEVITASSATGALHLALAAAGIGKDDVVVLPSNAFVAATQCAASLGASTALADVEPTTGLIEPESVALLLRADKNRRIKAIIPLHFAGQPTDLPALCKMARTHGALVIDDAEHALGASYRLGGDHYRIGNNPHSDMTILSFRAGMHITTGEGGAVIVDSPETAEKIRYLRHHNLKRTNYENKEMAFLPDGTVNPGYYEADKSGFNYRLTEIQAALGRSQLKRLQLNLKNRRETARKYHELLGKTFPDCDVKPLAVSPDRDHAYGLFVVSMDFGGFGVSRAVVMNRLRERGISTQVHYPPLHLQPRIARSCTNREIRLNGADEYYAKALTLPLFPEMTDSDVYRVVEETSVALREKSRFSRSHKPRVSEPSV